MEAWLPAFVLAPFSAACLVYCWWAELSQRCSYHEGRQALTEVTAQPDKAHTSCQLKIEQKCFKVYFANSPSELWLLASAMFTSPRFCQLPWDFHLLITETLKTWILTTVYQTCPLSSLFKACTTQLNPAIQPTRAFSPQTVLRLPTPPNTNQSYSSASLRSFCKEKGTTPLFRLQ